MAFNSQRHLRIPFHSAYFTTAIDTTIYCTVTDGNFCSFIFISRIGGILICTSVINSHHGFLTIVCVGLTLATAKDILSDRAASHVHLSITFHVGQVAAAIDGATDYNLRHSVSCRHQQQQQQQNRYLAIFLVQNHILRHL